MLKIDHFVIGAANLASGTEWMHAQLGVPPIGHGKHTAMSTHNALWRVGSAYLEVIAIDPGAPDPGRPRWYSLDDPATRAKLAEGPSLLTWVASTTDLPNALRRCIHDPGPVLDFARDDLVWKLTVPDDGHVPGDGAIPHLIEWPEPARSPSSALPDQGLEVARLSASCSFETAEMIERMGSAHLIDLVDDTSSLTLTIRTAAGKLVRIES